MFAAPEPAATRFSLMLLLRSCFRRSITISIRHPEAAAPRASHSDHDGFGSNPIQNHEHDRFS
jgi:hypothetical protein